MTDLLHDVDAPSDAELISRVRGGDVAAYGDLFSRHVEAAKRLSRQLVRGPDADDLVSEAFAKVLSVLQGGGGPDVAFRAYLLTAVRRLHVDRIRTGSRLQPSDDMEAFDPGVPFQDTAVAAFESGAAAKAFASLPERWQLVLWHLEVEGQKPADVAPLLGMSANSVSALAYRAREGLRQAFLTMHLNDISETDCRWVNEHLGAYVRNGLAKRESAKVQAHLDECRRCTAMYLELSEVNSNLAAIIAPLLLGAAAAGYLASTGTAAGGLGLMALLGRARDAVTANAGVATVGAVAAGVAAVATAGIMLLPSSGPEDVVGADGPIGTSSSPAEPGRSPGARDDSKSDPGPSPDEPATSPAAVLPSALPSATVGPSQDATPGDGATTPGGEPTGPGDGSTGSTEPDPTPTDPTPTEPTPTEPTPTEPTPTEPTPTEPTPTEPTPTPPVVYTIVAGPATVDNGQISFDLTGDPLPPQVFLTLESDPAGITFSGDGTCRLRLGDTTAVCDTSPDSALVAAPFARAVTTAAGDSFTVTMPLAGTPPRQDTAITVTLSAPEDVPLQAVTALFDVQEPEPTADVSLTGVPASVEAESTHDYVVPGVVAGVPAGYDGGATFSLSGPVGPDGPRAEFRDSGACTARPDGQFLDCSSLTNGAVEFLLHVKDNSEADTAVTIGLAALEGLPDPTPANNSATTTLLRFRPKADASVAAVDDVNGNSGKGTVTVTVGVTPSAPVRLAASYDVDRVAVTLPVECAPSESGAVCLVDGAGDVDFGVALVDRDGNETREAILGFGVTVPGYDDPVTDNDAASVTIRRFGDTTVLHAATRLLEPSTAGAPLADTPRVGADRQAGVPTRTKSAVEKVTKKAKDGKAHARKRGDARPKAKAGAQDAHGVDGVVAALSKLLP